MNTTEPASYTVVSPDVIPAATDVAVAGTQAGERVILIPMAEWKQCAQRGVRTFMQAAVFLFGGGTMVQLVTGMGIPPAAVANLPSTGNVALDAILYSLALALLVFVWNMVEFWLDIDIHAPRWRA